MLLGQNDLTIYEKYAGEWWDPNSPRFRSLQKVTEFRLKQIDHWFGSVKGKTIVDVGCGGGLLAVPMIERGAFVTGIDLSPASLETARRTSRGEGTYLTADARELPLDDKSADFVLLADVLDHIPDYEKALSEASRILKPGGQLYVNTINRSFRAWFLAILLGEGVGLIPSGTHDYRLFIKPRDLERTAQKHALRLEGFQGEAPIIADTIRNWAITFRASSSLAVAYSGFFRTEDCS